MAYTVLKGAGAFVDVSTGDSEAYLGVATSENSFVILRLTKRATQEIVRCHPHAHSNDITKVLTLTDNLTALSFVTLGLDSEIKVFSADGEFEAQTPAEGQLLNGVTVPGRRDYYLVSTFNEETQACGVAVYRKAKMLFRVGGPYTDPKLDLKVVGNVLFMPKNGNYVERVEIIGL